MLYSHYWVVCSSDREDAYTVIDIDIPQHHQRIVTPMQSEGVREYLHLAAAVISGIVGLAMAGASVFALAQALGHSLLAYGFATLVVAMLLVLITTFWLEYLPLSSRRLR